jgi:HNH endonuclease
MSALLSKHCERCGEGFLCWPSQQRRFCGQECHRAHKAEHGLNKNSRALPAVTLECAQCGKPFTVMGSHAKDYPGRLARKVCSKDCQALYLRSSDTTFICGHCGKETPYKYNKSSQGFVHSQRFCTKACADAAQRTGFIEKHGYRIFTIKGKQYAEHRLVMEQVLGRKLHPEETVHHKNGDRLDNRPENLELWAGRHGRGHRVEDQVADAVDLLKRYVEFLTAEQRDTLEDLAKKYEEAVVPETPVGHAGPSNSLTNTWDFEMEIK